MAAEADRFDAQGLDRRKDKTNLTHTGLLMEGLGITGVPRRGMVTITDSVQN